MQVKNDLLIPKGALQTRIPVRWTEMDSNGHVSNMYYQAYFDQARMNAFADCGVDLDYLRENNVGPVIYQANLEFRKELFYPDTALIFTYGTKIERSRGQLRQVLTSERTGEIICVGTFDGIFLDLVRKRPIAFPPELKRGLVDALVEESDRVLSPV